MSAVCGVEVGTVKAMRPLSVSLADDTRPYFLWDEDISVAELRTRLAGGDDDADRLLAKMLREANDMDVWRFVRPQRVADALSRLERRVGSRRYPFWDFLISTWRLMGYVAWRSAHPE